MANKLGRVVRVVLLAVFVMGGPLLWLFAGACSYLAWLPYTGPELQLRFLLLAGSSMGWALWGILEGPRRLPRWWFGLSYIVNVLLGFRIFVSGEPFSLIVSAFFLGYSVWHLIVCRPLERSRS